jgi:hypothetical protein
MNHTEKVRDSLARVPSEKRSSMVWRTGWGIAIILFGFAGKNTFPAIPDLVWFGTVAFGAVMMSGQLFTHPFRMFVAMVRDLFAAIRGKNGRNGDPPTNGGVP